MVFGFGLKPLSGAKTHRMDISCFVCVCEMTLQRTKGGLHGSGIFRSVRTPLHAVHGERDHSVSTLPLLGEIWVEHVNWFCGKLSIVTQQLTV